MWLSVGNQQQESGVTEVKEATVCRGRIQLSAIGLIQNET